MKKLVERWPLFLVGAFCITILGLMAQGIYHRLSYRGIPEDQSWTVSGILPMDQRQSQNASALSDGWEIPKPNDTGVVQFGPHGEAVVVSCYGEAITNLTRCVASTRGGDRTETVREREAATCFLLETTRGTRVLCYIAKQGYRMSPVNVCVPPNRTLLCPTPTP